MMERPEQLANAYELVARCDHYMVGIVENVTEDERDAAKEILITRQNALPAQRGHRFKTLSLALDIVERDRAEKRSAETMEGRLRVMLGNLARRVLDDDDNIPWDDAEAALQYLGEVA